MCVSVKVVAFVFFVLLLRVREDTLHLRMRRADCGGARQALPH